MLALVGLEGVTDRMPQELHPNAGRGSNDRSMMVHTSSHEVHAEQSTASWQGTTARSALTVAALRTVAGSKVLSRAYEYVDAMRVFDEIHGHVEALSEYSSAYAVELWWDSVGIHGRCTCPHGSLGHFCKHMVALGLRTLRDRERTLEDNNPEGVGGRDSAINEGHCLHEAEVSLQRFLQTISGEQARQILLELYLEEEDLEDLLERRLAVLSMDTLEKAESLFTQIREVTQWHTDVLDRHFFGVPGVRALVRDLEFMAQSGNEHVAYVAIERLLFRALTAFGSAGSDCADLRDTCEEIAVLHMTITRRVTPNPQQLACALVTMRDAKPQWLNMSFLPYRVALGEEGRAYCQREVEAIEERLRRGVQISTRAAFFQSKYADPELIVKRQRRELRLMKAELAYMSGDYDAVLELLNTAVPWALPGMLSVAVAREDWETAADLVEEAYTTERVSLSGTHGPWEADSLSAAHIVPQWAQEILIRAGRREVAAAYARQYFLSAPDAESARMWMEAIRSTDFEDRERETLRQRLLTHPRYRDDNISIFLLVDDDDGAWQWVEAYGAGREWRTLVFRDPQPYPQRALEYAAEECARRLANGARWELLMSDIARMQDLARRADESEGSTIHTQWMKQWRDRLWRLHAPHYQP